MAAQLQSITAVKLELVATLDKVEKLCLLDVWLAAPSRDEKVQKDICHHLLVSVEASQRFADARAVVPIDGSLL